MDDEEIRTILMAITDKLTAIEKTLAEFQGKAAGVSPMAIQSKSKEGEN